MGEGIVIRTLRVGHCVHPQFMTIRGGSWRSVAFPAQSMLLIHPGEGPILFDTGYDPAFFQATRFFPERLYRFATPVTLPAGEHLGDQLLRLGVEPADIGHLILSHFHADHIAGLHLFPKAKIHCARAGLTAARTGNRFTRTRRGFVSGLIPSDIDPRSHYFEDGVPVALPADLFPFTTGVDLFRDGSLIAVELPGHCPGHWGLLARDRERGWHFMVADAAWSGDAIDRNIPPPAITTSWLGNTGKARDTLAKLHILARRNTDIRLVPCHCPRSLQ